MATVYSGIIIMLKSSLKANVLRVDKNTSSYLAMVWERDYDNFSVTS